MRGGGGERGNRQSSSKHGVKRCKFEVLGANHMFELRNEEIKRRSILRRNHKFWRRCNDI